MCEISLRNHSDEVSNYVTDKVNYIISRMLTVLKINFVWIIVNTFIYFTLNYFGINLNSIYEKSIASVFLLSLVYVFYKISKDIKSKNDVINNIKQKDENIDVLFNLKYYKFSIKKRKINSIIHIELGAILPILWMSIVNYIPFNSIREVYNSFKNSESETFSIILDLFNSLIFVTIPDIGLYTFFTDFMILLFSIIGVIGVIRYLEGLGDTNNKWYITFLGLIIFNIYSIYYGFRYGDFMDAIISFIVTSFIFIFVIIIISNEI